MCGIAGILRSHDHPAERVRSMLDVMQHRGPDGRGEARFAGGAVGMVRLALVDLSPRGQQPLWSADGHVALIFNGEIYNFRALRRELEENGHRFRTGTDSEVVLELFLARGAECVHALRGMYAFAILDFRAAGLDAPPELILARGPFGMKPLYVYEPRGPEGPIVFASEIKAMLASGLVPAEVDRVGLHDFLRYGFVLQPRTMIRGVRMVETGTIEHRVAGRPLTVHRIPPWSAPLPKHEAPEEAAERLRGVLSESVQLHALADAPVGAFLSGGIDSSAIAALMARETAKLQAYTLKLTDVRGADEVDEATRAAAAIGCRLHVVEASGRQVRELLPAFARGLDQPSTDGLNTWLISRGAASDVKAVLSGLGGDEWFGGYPTTQRMLASTSTLQGRAEAGIAAQLARRPEWIRGPLKGRLDNFAQRESPLRIWIHGHKVFSWADSSRLAGRAPGDVRDGGVLSTLERDAPFWRELGTADLASLLDARVYMTNQLLRDSDATSMAHSLEVRCPFVDREVVAFARSCQRRYCVALHGAQPRQKRVLVQAMKGIIPEEVATRRKKGFNIPYRDWMQGALRELARDLTSSATVRARGLLDEASAAAVGQRARQGEPDASYPQLWALLTLELWCREVLDRAVSDPTRVQASPAA